jgi:hypothetical protein
MQMIKEGFVFFANNIRPQKEELPKMDKTKVSGQMAFLEKLKASVPPNISLANNMAELLNISVDGAYRRLRGETGLTVDEFFTLCKAFKISPDLVNSGQEKDGIVNFHYKHLGNEKINFDGYLAGIRKDMSQILKFEDNQIIFTAEDIPIWHYFNYPLLTGFKLFYWTKAILNVEEFQESKFDESLVDAKLMEDAQAIYQLYLKTNSIEIWSEETVVSVIKQIEYFWETNQFKEKETAINVLEELKMMIEDIRKSAERTIKYDRKNPGNRNTGNYAMYQCDLMIGNNTIFVKMGENKAVYLSYNTFNSITTLQPSFVREIEGWISVLIKKSILISGSAEKQRSRLFFTINQKIEQLIAHIRNV